MVWIRKTLLRWGKDYGIKFTKAEAKALGLRVGDLVTLRIRKVPSKPARMVEIEVDDDVFDRLLDLQRDWRLSSLSDVIDRLLDLAPPWPDPPSVGEGKPTAPGRRKRPAR